MPKPNFMDHKTKISGMIRVNHAGEFGAKCIYEGQLKFIKNTHDYSLIHNMMEQEKKHLDYFNTELVKNRIRPTILMPIWKIGGHFVGAISAIAGIRFAMLVTQSVEEVIEQHYDRQLIELANNTIEQNLSAHIQQFRAEEIEHKEIATNYQKMSFMGMTIEKLVKNICKTAIYLSTRL